MRVEQIDIADIVVADRLRAVDAARTSFLAENMDVHGLRQPIEVRRVKHDNSIRLIAGAHRLAAAASLDWTVIDAVIVSVANEDEARLLEIDENLVRNDLNVFDEARFLVERKEVWERLYPETQWGSNRGSSQADGRQTDNSSVWQNGDDEKRVDNLSTHKNTDANGRGDILSFCQDIAARMGIHERTIRRKVTMYMRLSPQAREIVGGTPLAGNASELEAIGKLPEENQAEVAIAVTLGQDARVRDAVMRLCRTEDQSETKSRVQRSLDQISRWSKAEQAELLRGLQGLAPVGYSVSTPFDDSEGEAD